MQRPKGITRVSKRPKRVVKAIFHVSFSNAELVECSDDVKFRVRTSRYTVRPTFPGSREVDICS